MNKPSNKILRADGKAGFMLNRVSIVIIAISQFLLALALGGVGMAGGLSRLLLAFAVFGLVSACLLPFFGVVSRAVALAWHLIFVSSLLANARAPNNKTDTIVIVWAVLDLAAILYLAKTILDSFRNPPKSQTQPQ